MRVAKQMPKWVYGFAEGSKEMRDLLGGKGANVAEMTRVLSSRSTTSTRAKSSPQDPQEQLRLAIRAVFDSGMGERAVAYRRANHISDDWGTAVSVQQMVFGNKGDTSGSGVAFSRDEVTGAPEPDGDFLPNAQGEDVVEMKDWLPGSALGAN